MSKKHKKTAEKKRKDETVQTGQAAVDETAAGPEEAQPESGAAAAPDDTGDGEVREAAAGEAAAEKAEPELSPEEILRRERDEYKEKWLRVMAELDNVRKRSRRELVDGRRFAQAEVLRAFLEVQDNFERALQSMGDREDTGSHQSLREGVELIFQNFRRVLKDQGVLPIETLEQDFDPALHEAVGQMEREGVEPGKVIEVVQQGFRMGDLVLRPSRVIISG